MKVWGIVATVLVVIFIGTSTWLYIQNRDLKNQKSQLETDLSTTKTSDAAKLTAANDKMTAASKKIAVLAIFFSGTNDATAMNQAHDSITAMNNTTLTADWDAMQTTGSNAAGTKMMQDLISAVANDLK